MTVITYVTYFRNERLCSLIEGMDCFLQTSAVYLPKQNASHPTKSYYSLRSVMMSTLVAAQYKVRRLSDLSSSHPAHILSHVLLWCPDLPQDYADLKSQVYHPRNSKTCLNDI